MMSEVEGALRVASTTVKHNTDDLDTRIAALVEKAKASSESDPWLKRSETAIKSLLLTGFMLARSDLSDDDRERLPAGANISVAELHELGWGELFARLEMRISAPRGSNLPPHDSPLGRGGNRLLGLLKKPPKKN